MPLEEHPERLLLSRAGRLAQQRVRRISRLRRGLRLANLE
jgi:hypothetical protein